jgi:SAM-dependent methyltransferase
VSTVTGERVSTDQGGFNPTFQRHRAAYRAAATYLPEHGTTLDLGCGTGHSADELAPRQTFGVDVDPEALERQPRPTFAADMRTTPFDDDAFTGLVCIHAIEHVPDPEAVAQEAARVLHPDGIAVFVTPTRTTTSSSTRTSSPASCAPRSARSRSTACSAPSRTSTSSRPSAPSSTGCCGATR